MAKLTFVLDDGQEVVVPLAEHITIGRGDDNDVVVDDDRISKRHAELVHNADGTIQLFDSNSTAGTFVNGERVRSRTIRHGDELTFGLLTAVIDFTDHPAKGNSPALAPAAAEDVTQAVTIHQPVQAGKIATRKRSRGGRPDSNAQLEMEKARLQPELDTVQKELRDWQEQSAAEHAMHLARIDSLRAEEERLTPIKTAVHEAETAHGAWLQSIQSLATRHEEHTASLQRLTTQHEEKAADLQRLGQNEIAARHELEGLATHRDQALAHLHQIRAESVQDETAINDLRRQLAELETRSHQSREIFEIRADQLKAAEKKIEQLSHHRAQIEAHIHELTGTEEKLVQARAHCQEAEAQHATLTAAIAALGLDQQRSTAAVQDIESNIATLQQSHQQAVVSRQHDAESLQHLQNQLAACQKDLATRSAELAAETQQLAQTQARHAELDQQCQALADTAQKLTVVQTQLATAEEQLVKVQTTSAALEAQIAEVNPVMKTLAAEESAAKGRIAVLHARQVDLRAELTQLDASERSHRTRFEEVFQLVSEAEKEHAAQQQQHASSLESARTDLADLLSHLQPLREWKEAMDLLYARLATLPQDSTEARDLWHEIEREKAGLHELITTARTQAQAGATPAPLPPSAPPVTVEPEPPRKTRSGGVPAVVLAQEITPQPPA